MKKLLKVLAASMMLVGLAACEPEVTPEPGPTPEEQAQALSDAKTTAISVLDGLVAAADPKAYTAEDYAAIATAVAEAKTAINAATDVFAVSAALNAAKASIAALPLIPVWEQNAAEYLDDMGVSYEGLDLSSLEDYTVEFAELEDEDGEYGAVSITGQGADEVGGDVLYDLFMSGWVILEADEDYYDWGYVSYTFRSDFNERGQYMVVEIEMIFENSLYSIFYEPGTEIYVWSEQAYSAAEATELYNTLNGDGLTVEIPAEEEGEEPEVITLLAGLGYPEETNLPDNLLGSISPWWILDYELGNGGEDVLNKAALYMSMMNASYASYYRYPLFSYVSDVEYDEDFESYWFCFSQDMEITEEPEDLTEAIVDVVDYFQNMGIFPAGLEIYDPFADEEDEDFDFDFDFDVLQLREGEQAPATSGEQTPVAPAEPLEPVYDDEEEYAYAYYYDEDTGLDLLVETYFYEGYGLVYEFYAVGENYVSSMSLSTNSSESSEAKFNQALETAEWEIVDKYAATAAYIAYYDVAGASQVPFLMYYDDSSFTGAFNVSLAPSPLMIDIAGSSSNLAGMLAMFGLELPSFGEKGWNVWEELDYVNEIAYEFGFDNPAKDKDGKTLLPYGENYLALYNYVIDPANGWVLEVEEEEEEEDLDDLVVAALREGEQAPVAEQKPVEVPEDYFLASSKDVYVDNYGIAYKLVLYVEAGSYYTEVAAQLIPVVDGTLEGLFEAYGLDELYALVPSFDDAEDVTFDVGVYSLNEQNTTITVYAYDYYDEAKVYEIRESVLKMFDKKDWDIEESNYGHEFTLTSKNEGPVVIVIKITNDYEHHEVLLTFSYQLVQQSSGEQQSGEQQSGEQQSGEQSGGEQQSGENA